MTSAAGSTPPPEHLDIAGLGKFEITTSKSGAIAVLKGHDGTKDFYVTLSFDGPTNKEKIAEFINQRDTKDKINRLMDQYKILKNSDFGAKEDFRLESKGDQTVMKYKGHQTTPQGRKQTVERERDISDQAKTEGMFRNKIAKYQTKLAQAGDEPTRTKYREKERKITELLRKINPSILPVIVLARSAQALLPPPGTPLPNPLAQSKPLEPLSSPPPPLPRPSQDAELRYLQEKYRREMGDKATFTNLSRVLSDPSIDLGSKDLEKFQLIYYQILLAETPRHARELTQKFFEALRNNPGIPEHQHKNINAAFYQDFSLNAMPLTTQRLLTISKDKRTPSDKTTGEKQLKKLLTSEEKNSPDTTALLKIYHEATSGPDLEARLNNFKPSHLNDISIQYIKHYIRAMYVSNHSRTT